jgi:F-type H+-transporting ATPase subunit delta
MHRELKASRRYAKSLLDLAVEQGTLEEVSKDMALLSRTYKENPALVKMLRTPLVKADTKQKVLSTIFKGKLSLVTMRFIDLIVAKRRESVLPGIALSFEDQRREHYGIALAHITTAIPLNDTQRNAIKDLVLKVHKKVELKETVDPDIIAGFSVQVGDRLYDETVQSRIKDLKKFYWNNPYVSKI